MPGVVDASAPIHYEVYEPVEVMSDHEVLEEVEWAGSCHAKRLCAQNAECSGFFLNVRDGRVKLFRWKDPAMVTARLIIREAVASGGSGITKVFIKVRGNTTPLVQVVEENELDFTPYSFIPIEKTGILGQRHVPESSSGGVVISLTTIPSRIDDIKGTLQSLMAQTVAPQEIFVCIPETSTREKGKQYIIPGWLEEMKGVTLLKCDRDYGPSTKLIPIVQVGL